MKANLDPRNGSSRPSPWPRLCLRAAERDARRGRARRFSTGKVVSSTGEPLAGIPIKAHRDNSTITVAVYTDAKGEYSFPTWSDLTPGSYSVGDRAAGFRAHRASRSRVAEGKPAKIDFTLKAKPLAYEDATASEIIAGLPGTDQQKVLFSQCSNCHTLQWALAVPRPQGRLGQGHQEDGGPRRRGAHAGHLCVQPEAVHRAAGGLSGLDPRTRLLRQDPVQATPTADRCGLHQSRRDRIRAAPRRRARTLHVAWRPAVRLAARRHHERQIRLLHRSLLLRPRPRST